MFILNLESSQWFATPTVGVTWLVRRVLRHMTSSHHHQMKSSHRSEVSRFSCWKKSAPHHRHHDLTMFLVKASSSAKKKVLAEQHRDEQRQYSDATKMTTASPMQPRRHVNGVIRLDHQPEQDPRTMHIYVFNDLHDQVIPLHFRNIQSLVPSSSYPSSVPMIAHSDIPTTAP